MDMIDRNLNSAFKSFPKFLQYQEYQYGKLFSILWYPGKTLQLKDLSSHISANCSLNLATASVWKHFLAYLRFGVS